MRMKKKVGQRSPLKETKERGSPIEKVGTGVIAVVQ